VRARVSIAIALAAGLSGAPASGASVAAATAQEPPLPSGAAGPPDARDLDATGVDASRRARIDDALKTGAYDRAQTLLLEEVARNPRSPELLRMLGGVLFLTGGYLNSAIALKKAEALAPLDDRSRFTLAMSYIVMRQRPWARPELERLAAGDPPNPLYPYWIARLEYDDQHYAAAVDGFRHVVALDPGYFKAYDNLGLSYEALGRDDEAIKSYQEALRLNRERGSHSPWPSLNLGILLTRLDRLDEAETVLRESAREDARFAAAHYQLGVVLDKKGQTAAAIAEMSQATRLDPAYPEPQYALARLYRRAGELEKAEGALARFLALKKKDQGPSERR
jgi:tetratricopeptide (TPR) repeat protein